MPYQLRLFGELGIRGPEGGATDLALTPSKGTAVLAYLGTRPTGEAVPREDLLPLLWPERSEEAGRNALRSTLSRLRGRLPEGALGGKGEGRLWLDDSTLTTDVRAFEAALEADRRREALDLYRGPFLEHFRVPGVRPFDRWADGRRETYRREAYRAALSLGRDAEEQEEWASAEEAYREALELAPMKEEAAAGVARALAGTGNRAEALRYCRDFRDRLEGELGLSPSDSFTELAGRIRSRAGSAGTGGPGEDGRDRRSDGGSGGTADSRSVPPRAGAVVLLAAVLAGAALWHAATSGDNTSRGSRAAARPGGSGAPVVAVLPFQAIGSAGTDGVFRRGLHAGLITRLSNVSDLSVLSRSSVLPHGRRTGDLSAVAESLDADWLVEGGVQTSGDRVQVNVRLVRPGTGTQAWADSYRRELTTENVFAIQGELTRRIAGSLEAELSPAERQRIQRRPTESLEAYRLYVRGRALADQRTEAEVRSALRYFRRAVRRDSGFALAWSGLADAYAFLWYYDYSPPDSISGPALRAARRAVELDPTLGEAHASLGILHSLRQEGPEALRRLTRAARLKPSHPETQVWLGWVHLVLGRPESSLEPARRAVELDPTGPPYRVYLADALLATGREEEALRHARRARELRPDYGMAHFMVGLVLHHLGRHGQAERAFRKTRSLASPHGSPTRAEATAAVAAARAAAGDTAGARGALRTIDGEESPFAEALAAAAVGEVDRAFAAFRRVREWTSIWTEHVRYFFPRTLAPLRSDPRYDSLIRRLNRAWGLEADGSLPRDSTARLGAHWSTRFDS